MWKSCRTYIGLILNCRCCPVLHETSCYVIVFDNNGFVTARKVNFSSNNGTYKLDIPEIEEVVDSLLESDVTEISFQDIVNYYGEENLVVTDNNSKGQFVPVSKTFSKEARSKGFKIEAKENSQKLEISITDNKSGATCQLPNGPEVSEDYENFDVSLDIDSILVGSQIKYKRLIDVEYASVAVDIHSKFEGGVATDTEVGDKILLFEVPTSLDCGVVSVKIQIYLVTTIDGEIFLEAELPYQNAVHYEKGKGLRIIKHDIAVENPIIEASAELKTKVRIAPILIVARSWALLDAEYDMGVAARAKVDIRDTSQVCADVTMAFPIFKISVGDEDVLYNGKKTFLADKKITGNWEIISFENALKKIGVHFEILPNGTKQFVDKCTYKAGVGTTNNLITYTTRGGKINKKTVPVFQFDYPSNWSVAYEEVSEINEYVELSNDAGVVIRYQYIAPEYAVGSSRITDEIIVEKVAESKLVLESESTDMLGTGKFVVAKVYTISSVQQFAMKNGEEKQYISADDAERYKYAVKPAVDCGTKTVDGNYANGFMYNGLVEFVAELPENITLENEQEVIDILSSFRVARKDASKEEKNLVMTDDPIYNALANGDYSYFAGTYKACDCYKDLYGGGKEIDDLVLQEDGIISGGGLWYSPVLYPDTKPISVTKQEDGSYLCQVTYHDDKAQNYFVIYPEGVIGKNPYGNNDSLLTTAVYIQYMKIGGGVSDIIYYKIEE